VKEDPWYGKTKKMDDLKKEKEQGLDFEYLMDVLQKLEDTQAFFKTKFGICVANKMPATVVFGHRKTGIIAISRY